MDADHFDALTRSLSAAGSRRGALVAALGGSLGIIGLAHPDDATTAKSGKCRDECDLCEFCKRGKCRKTKSGKKRCKKGTCKPQENGTPCASVGGTCQGGQCFCPDGKGNCGASCCINNQICENGTCICPAGLELCNGACVPVCIPDVQARNRDTCTCCFVNGIPCTGGPSNSFCCANVCLPGTPPPPQSFCPQGDNGTPCNVGANCISGFCSSTNGRCAFP